MKESIMWVVRAYRDFNETGMYMALFYCALLYLWYIDTDRHLRRMWVYPSLVFLLLLLNPLIMRYIVDLAFDYASRPRVFWTLPIICVIALAATKVISGCNKTKEKVVLGILICAALILCGKFKYTNEYLVKPTNPYDLPQEVVDIADYVLKEYDNPKLLVPIELATAMRIYNSDIRLLYGEDVVFGRIQYMGPTPFEPEKPEYTIYQSMKEERPDIPAVVELIQESGCNYIIFDNEIQKDYKIVENYGYLYVKTISHYDIFKEDNRGQNS